MLLYQTWSISMIFYEFLALCRLAFSARLSSNDKNGKLFHSLSSSIEFNASLLAMNSDKFSTLDLIRPITHIDDLVKLHAVHQVLREIFANTAMIFVACLGHHQTNLFYRNDPKTDNLR